LEGVSLPLFQPKVEKEDGKYIMKINWGTSDSERLKILNNHNWCSVECNDYFRSLYEKSIGNGVSPNDDGMCKDFYCVNCKLLAIQVCNTSDHWDIHYSQKESSEFTCGERMMMEIL
jgi:hypothetical protein